MIALIVLIAAVVVVGGGIEFLRRARFGVGPSAAHHRALDTLGHITTQSPDSKNEIVESEEPEVLSHMRRAVESDRAQPRIEPQPVSRPVAVPAITGGPNFVGTVPPGQAHGRGPQSEIEGVRLLVPEDKADDQGSGDEPEGRQLEAAGQMVLPIEGDGGEGDQDWDDEGDQDWDEGDQDRHEEDQADADRDWHEEDEDWDDEAVQAVADRDWHDEAPQPEVGWGEAGWDEAEWDDEGEWDGSEGGDWQGEATLAQPEVMRAPADEAVDDGLGNLGDLWAAEDAEDRDHWVPPLDPITWEDEDEAGQPPQESATWAVPERADEPGERAPDQPAGWAADDRTAPVRAVGAGDSPDDDDATAGRWQGVTGWDSVLHEGVGRLSGPAWEEHAREESPAGWYGGEPAGAPADEEVSRWAHDDQAATLSSELHAPQQPEASGLHAPEHPDEGTSPATDEPAAERIIRIDDYQGSPANPVHDADNVATPSWRQGERVVRIDDLGESGWVTEGASSTVAVGHDRGQGEAGSLALPHDRGDGHEADDTSVPHRQSHDGDESGDEPPIAIRFDDLGGTATTEGAPDLRPQHVSAGPERQSGAIPGLTPDETRAQLAALAQSGGMNAVPGATRRRHRRRRNHDRRHRLSSAAMILAAVLIFGGAVFLVANSSSGGHPHRSPAAAHPPATSPPAPTTTVPAASLISQTGSTATYQVSGSPTIELTFNSSCWTQIRQGSSSGSVVFEGTETAGSTRQLTGPVWVRLGDPAAVQVTVGGTTLNQPAMTAASPFNLQFQ